MSLHAWRWQPRTPTFILAAALANTVLYHEPLFAFAVSTLDLASAGAWRTLVTAFVAVTLFTALGLGLVAVVSERLLKPVLMAMALANAVALYFVHAYGVILDKSMMGNVLDTDVAEAGALFHPLLLAYLLLAGGLPCLALSRMRLRRTALLPRLALPGLVFLALVAWAYANSPTWLWFDKYAKRLGGMTLPWSYVINGARHAGDRIAPRAQRPLPAATFSGNGKTVVMLLIGEAARTGNFSLYGYARPTNPRLAREGVIALPNATACSTYTTESLRCILSHVDGDGAGWEPLTSYLYRSGVDVIWRSNNWGEPAMRVGSFERAAALRNGCAGEGCQYDEVLLHGLAERIRASRQDRLFIVLHLGGSHGPAYYAQYPARFAAFTPVCKTVDLQNCSRQELVNAYDNTLLYEDHVIGEAIKVLKGFPERATTLIYLSDHGESLGEYGLYLHGTPYSLAPGVQKDIPFIVWMSDAFRRHKQVRADALAAGAQHSQAEVFHSVMGAFGMRSPAYRPGRDIFADAGAPP